MSQSDNPRILRFADCEIDVQACRLTRDGRVVGLERLPMELLLMLVAARGRLVSRDSIFARLWGSDPCVDVEAGLNTAIRKVRKAIGDGAEHPRLIDTVAGRGYRFNPDVSVEPHPAHSTLAVLPFDNLSGDPGLTWLAEGLTEEMIAALGHVGGDDFRVLGRTSVARLRGGVEPMPEAARALGADHLVEGSVRADGDTLRVTCRVVRVVDQTLLWSVSVDRVRADLLGLQRELSLSIADRVRGSLAPARLDLLARRQTDDATAYDLYLQGRHHWNQLTPPTTLKAIDCFTRATRRDPRYALAWCGLADAWSSSPVTGDAAPSRAAPLAAAAADEALRAQPELPETQASVGVVKFWLDWDWREAERYLSAACRLGPNYAYGLRMQAHVLSQSGRHAEAQDSIRRAREIDPFYFMHQALSAQIAFQARDYAAALTYAKHALAIDANAWIAHFQLAQVCAELGDVDEALRSVDRSVRLSANSKALALKGYLYARCGRIDTALGILEVLDAASRERYMPPYAKALLQLGLDDVDAALVSLHEALVARDVHLVFLPVDPKWDRIRGDSRFAGLLAACGFHRANASPTPGLPDGGCAPAGPAR